MPPTTQNNIVPVPTYGTKVQGGLAVFNPNTGAPLAGAGAYNPNTGVSLNPTNIAPVTPYTIPPVVTGGATNALGLTTGQANAPTFPTDVNSPTYKKDSANYMLSLINGLSGEATATANAQKEQGVLEKKALAKKYETDSMALSNTYNNQVSALKGNGGMTQEQLAPQLADLGAKYQSQQADIAINRAVANNDYTSAVEIADQQVKAKYEPMKAQLDALVKFQQYNNNDLTDSEKLKLAAKIEKDKMAYQSALDLGNYKAKNAIDVAALNSGVSTTPSAPTSYTVTANDTGGLYAIATNNGIDFEALKLANPTLTAANNYQIKPGQKLNLPTTNITHNNQDALNVILGSGKFTKDQKQDLIRSINSGQDPLTVIKNQAKNIMGQTEATKIASYETARDTLSDIGKELAAFYAAGGKTNLIKGKLENVYQKLGTVKDPTLRNLAIQLQGNIQIYRNAISGTAYSAQEGQDIANIFPGIDNSKTLNQTILDARSKLFDSTIDSMYRGTIGPSYDQLKVQSGTYNGIKIPGASNLGSYSFGGVTL